MRNPFKKSVHGKRRRKKLIYTKKRLQMIDQIVESADWSDVRNPKQCKAVAKLVMMLLLPTVFSLVDATLEEAAA